MRVHILAIGRRHDKVLQDILAMYERRLTRSLRLSWQLLEPAKGRTDGVVMRRIESDTILMQLRQDDYVVLLDEHGEQLTSREFANTLEGLQNEGRRVVCIIGGAFGVERTVNMRAHMVWSLSRLTFPHQLVRLVLIEQLYRATTIMRGEPYHHA